MPTNYNGTHLQDLIFYWHNYKQYTLTKQRFKNLPENVIHLCVHTKLLSCSCVCNNKLRTAEAM